MKTIEDLSNFLEKEGKACLKMVFKEGVYLVFNTKILENLVTSKPLLNFLLYCLEELICFNLFSKESVGMSLFILFSYKQSITFIHLSFMVYGQLGLN